MNTVVSTGIEIGSLVGLKRLHANPDTQDRLLRWIRAYGRGPFRVRGKIDQTHVALQEMEAQEGQKEPRIIRFGSTDDAFLNTTYVEPWKE